MRQIYFNPRFPRGKRLGSNKYAPWVKKFQSTLPAGEATLLIFCTIFQCPYFNPRFPRGKRLKWDRFFLHPNMISIHASRGGSDLSDPSARLAVLRFQSTLPAGEATQAMDGKKLPGLFQSTLPAGEATASPVVYQCSLRHFNPRFPRGKRLL